MAIEVEAKAHIEDPRHIQVALEELAGISAPTAIDKEDRYLGPDADTLVVRVRKEAGKLFITHKRRNIVDGVETNDEVEFSTDSAQEGAVLALFAALGHSEQLYKRKTGLRWEAAIRPDLGALTIEVCEVVPLGWFIEAEFLLEDPSLVDEARRALLQTLSLVGIDRSHLESRPYMILLKEQGSAARPQRPDSGR